MTERRRIEVAALARVEGEGALHLVVEAGQVVELRLEIYEPPRFFEALTRGRRADELPDLLARICGICPVAYQMCAVHAVEAAWGVAVPPTVRALRRLYYAGEWIESHVLHMMFLAAPDLLGLDDAMSVARAHREQVARALRLRKLGNRILVLLGGRSVNPVGVRIGGFHRLPAPAELHALGDELRRARGEAEAMLHWFESLPVPSRPQDVELVALRHPGEYPMNEGRLVSSRGLDVAGDAWESAFEEHQVRHSTALHARRRGGDAPYLVGPLARVTLNADRLSPAARARFEALAPRFARPDPAASVFARGIEVVQAIDDALAVTDAPVPPPAATEVAVNPRAAAGAATTEAPRGILHVALATDGAGLVSRLRIVPPTSQNQAQIEADLRALAPGVLALSDDEARRACEAAIRDYDPCISCATHFLTVTVERREPEPCAST
ncbi:MAG TPA: nickel-dependent hydrogenase large subunit [Myxococcota bacterium]|nr:nickel-dependent hydrogenase large subunit [Myxococcota bacterium]